MKKILSFIVLILFIVSCEDYSQESYRELVVVETYLVANRVLPEVRVSRTLPVDAEYSFADAALSGANIQISLLDDAGIVEESFGYFPQSAGEGVYSPADQNHLVIPGRTYRIDIDFLNRSEVLAAETTVPFQVQVINEVQNEVVYQSAEQLEIVLAPTEKTGKQNVFVFNNVALEPEAENLTPFYMAVVNDGDSEVADFVQNSSGLINEGNFTVNEDGTILLNFPWIGVAFYGNTLVVTNSVDQNLTEFIRSKEVQLGGSTLSPGEIPNIRYNIDGGIGVFGSISSDTVQTRFLRREEL
jgi:hypothetical protein